MVLVWRGWGFLVPVIVFGTSLAMELLTERMVGDEQFYQTRAWPLAAALAIAGIAIWILGRYLDARGARVVVDKATGQEMRLGGSHQFLFVPMHYWGLLLMAGAVVSLALAGSGALAGSTGGVSAS